MSYNNNNNLYMPYVCINANIQHLLNNIKLCGNVLRCFLGSDDWEKSINSDFNKVNQCCF